MSVPPQESVEYLEKDQRTAEEQVDLRQKVEFLEKELSLQKTTIDQLKVIVERLENPGDKAKSFNDIKKELKGFFSMSGHSVLLETNNLFKKVFSICFLLILFYVGMFLSYRNLLGYLAHDVVTQIKVIDDETLSFPAVTFCLTEFDNERFPELSDAFNLCNFDNHPCTFDDFEFVPIYAGPLDMNLKCYKFNGGRTGSGILSASKVGIYSGLSISFNLNKSELLQYYAGETNVKPIWTELNNLVQQNAPKIVYVELKKLVDIKIPKPYSNCTENINTESSDLVKEIIQQNITYRQKYCYELCNNNFVNEYSFSKNTSKREAWLKLQGFDYKGNCSHICPLECSSTVFEVLQTETLPDHDGILEMKFFYSDLKYTEISQSIKTTEADLISNTGGVLGLFLELSFLSAYRVITFAFEIICS